jgi:hypothetical protein
MARAPVSKFYRDRPGHCLRITERADLSALLERPGVLRPFPSRLVPLRSVANSVATDANCSRPRVRLYQRASGTSGRSCIHLRSFPTRPTRTRTAMAN